MNITTQEANGVTTVVFEGSLDTNTAPDAEAKLGELVNEGAAKILIDFSSLDYISSAGLRVLLVTGKKLGSSGGSMRLCNLNETVDEVFEISGFSTIFNVFPTLDEAVSGF
jgi:anti-anti-sigma factor